MADMTCVDPIVCVCAQVSEDAIVLAIRGGADTVAKVREASNANTGCGGCLADIEELIVDELGEP